MRHGEINTNNDVSGKALRTGAVTMAVVDGTSKAVTFGAAMPSTDYHVFLQVQGNLAVVLWPTTKTVSGFTIAVSLAIAGEVAYLAVVY